MKLVSTSLKLLGWGSVALGSWGLIHPKSLTGLMGDDPAIGRFLGVRDAIVGVSLLNVSGPLPIAMRIASDLHDAIRLRERSPLAAIGAAGVTLWGTAVLAGLLLKTDTTDALPSP